jgi:hypothetical protein
LQDLEWASIRRNDVARHFLRSNVRRKGRIAACRKTSP